MSNKQKIKRLVLKLIGRREDGQESGQQASQYYNSAFSANPEWRGPYTKSPYYCIWTVIIDRLRQTPRARVLEIGCGPGQLAGAMNAAGVFSKYVGIDFSDVAIEIATEKNPHLQFVLENAVTTDLYATEEYDTVVTTEFLEHVYEDLEVIGKLRSGTRLIGTVPNFPYISHVRHFDNADAVRQRYGGSFRNLSVTEIPGVQTDSIFFLLDGIKN